MKSNNRTPNWERRLGIDRRQFSYSNYYPEKRSGDDRRSGDERRERHVEIDKDRRSDASQKSCLRRLLLHRLKDSGVDRNVIPGFIRNLANSVFVNPHLNLFQVNKRLKYLGWEEFELDYHTFQLALNFFESEGIETLQYRSARWFENTLV